MLCGITYMWTPEKCNKLVNIAEKKLTNVENKLVVIKWEKVGRVKDRGEGSRGTNYYT